MNILITICARAGSKGLPNKHMLDMRGKPLIQWTINCASEAERLFNDRGHPCQTITSTDIKEFHNFPGVIQRPDYLCGDNVPKLDVIRHIFSFSGDNLADCAIDLDATNPMRTVDDIMGAFDLFINEGRNVLTAVGARKNPYFNQVQAVPFGVKLVSDVFCANKTYIRRQSAPPVYDLNASISIFGKKTLLNESVKSATEDPFTIYLMPDHTAFDIDTELDFKIVEMIMREKIKEGLL